MSSVAKDSGFLANGKVTVIPALAAVFFTFTPITSSDQRANLGCRQILVSILHFSQELTMPRNKRQGQTEPFVHHGFFQIHDALGHFALSIRVSFMMFVVVNLKVERHKKAL
jgi:hypothetical protein